MTNDPSLMQIGTRNRLLQIRGQPLLHTSVGPNISHSWGSCWAPSRAG